MVYHYVLSYKDTVMDDNLLSQLNDKYTVVNNQVGHDVSRGRKFLIFETEKPILDTYRDIDIISLEDAETLFWKMDKYLKT